MNQLTVNSILKILRHRLDTILSISILCGMLGLTLTYFFVAPKYTASASLYVFNENTRTSDGVTIQDINASQALVNTYIVIIRSETVLNQVLSEIEDEFPSHGLTPTIIRKSMFSASSIDDTEAFSISITSKNSDLSMALTEKLVEIAPKEIIRVVKAGSVELIDPARLDEKIDWPILRNTAVAFAVGLFISAFWALWAILSDTHVYDETQLKANFNITIIGTVPTIRLNGKERRKEINKNGQSKKTKR